MPTKTYEHRPKQRHARRRWDSIAEKVKPGRMLRMHHDKQLIRQQFQHRYRVEVEFLADELPPSQP